MALLTRFKEVFNAPIKESTFTKEQHRQMETINTTIFQTLALSNFTNNKKLAELEETLIKFDSDIIYANIHCDLTEKYKLGKEYFKVIEERRQELVREGKLKQNATGKEDLIKKLDAVVPSLIKDFLVYADEKYRLLDEIFLMKTNTHWRCDEEDLVKRVNEVLIQPEVIYNQEFEKMCKIHDILEEEEKRLQRIK